MNRGKTENMPMIYCYSTPDIPYHEGWVKIGYTTKNVDRRIYKQTQNADIKVKKEWQIPAIFEYGDNESFTDKDFHLYLKLAGVENKGRTEWFKINPDEARLLLLEFKVSKRNRTTRKNLTLPYDITAIIAMFAEENLCSESEAVSRMVRHYAKTERQDFYKKARNEINVLEEEKERFE